ncbi:hypothetical protein M405DRAFT_886205 [Rhizopogon salebrosus TDB-379]|nr:hypothetical protein M405DRAFT_886205 [Rhizopogon salebrosus TDB-379]
MMDWTPSNALRNLQHVVNVMNTASKNIFAEKKATMENEGFIGSAVNRMKANASSSDDDRLADSGLLGQMKTFSPDYGAKSAKQNKSIPSLKVCLGLGKTQKYPTTHLWDCLIWMQSFVKLFESISPQSNLIRSASGEMISAVHVPENTMLINSIPAANHNKQTWGKDASLKNGKRLTYRASGWPDANLLIPWVLENWFRHMKIASGDLVECVGVCELCYLDEMKPNIAYCWHNL